MTNEIKDLEKITENNLENERIEKMFNLIKTNPNFMYAVSINGNLSGKDRNEINGQKDFHYDQKTGKIELSSTGFNSSEYACLDYNNVRNPKLIPFKPKFEIYDWKRKFDGKEFRHFIYRLGFNGRTENGFTRDLRPGVHISTALRVLKDNKIFDELPEQKLKGYISKPETEEAKKFFRNLFNKANHEFIPDYWNFVFKERDLYLGQNKK